MAAMKNKRDFDLTNLTDDELQNMTPEDWSRLGSIASDEAEENLEAEEDSETRSRIQHFNRFADREMRS